MKRENKKQTKRKGKRKREKNKKEKTHSSTLKGVKFSYIKREILSLEVNRANLGAF